MANNTTHTQTQINETEELTGLRFGGYMKAGEDPFVMLVPVYLKPGYTQDEVRAKIMKLNRDY